MADDSHSAVARVTYHKQNGCGHTSAAQESVQDRLKSIGQRVAALQAHLSSTTLASLATDDTAVKEAWSLLVALRPFLFLACSDHCAHSLARHPVTVALRTHERKRDLHHVGLALRLYNTLVRMTIGVPHAALHACLVLLSLLPQLASRFHSTGSDGERYMDGLRHHLVCLAAVDSAAFTQLIQQLLRDVVPAVTAPHAYNRRRSLRDTVLQLRVCPLSHTQLEPYATMLSLASVDEAATLFDGQLIVSDRFDHVTTSTALAALLTHLVNEGALTCRGLGGVCGDGVHQRASSASELLLDLADTVIVAGIEGDRDNELCVGQKRVREEGSAAGAVQERPSGKQRTGSADCPSLTQTSSAPSHLLRHGLSLLRALVASRLIEPTVHGPSVLRIVLTLWSAVDHVGLWSCSSQGCALDMSAFALDFLEEKVAGASQWTSRIVLADADQRGRGDLLVLWYRTLFDQYSYLRAMPSSRSASNGENEANIKVDSHGERGDETTSGALPPCMENVYRLQCLLQTAVAAAHDVSPASTATRLLQTVRAVGGVREEALRMCLCSHNLPLFWYENDERLDGFQCPEHELWAILPFGAPLLSALVTLLSQLKETLSVSELQMAKAHAYAIVALTFRRHAHTAKFPDEEGTEELSYWIQERWAELQAGPSASTSEAAPVTDTTPPLDGLPVSFGTLTGECLHVLAHHANPDLPSVLNALTLSLRVARLIERPDVLRPCALNIMHALDEHLTTHKEAITGASPVTWRALLRMTSWYLPALLTPRAALGASAGADKPFGEEENGTEAVRPVQSRSVGVLRHLLILTQRGTSSSVRAWDACATGLMRGLALRITHTLTCLADTTNLSLASLHYQAAAGHAGGGDHCRVKRARAELRRCVGSLAILLQDAQPVLAFIVRRLSAATEADGSQPGTLSRANSGTLVGAKQRRSGELSHSRAALAASVTVSSLTLPDGTLPFLMALSCVALLARDWVTQAPSTLPLFDISTPTDVRGSAAGSVVATVVDVDDEEEVNSDSGLTVAEQGHKQAGTSSSAGEEGNGGTIGVFPSFITGLAAEGIDGGLSALAKIRGEGAEEGEVALAILLKQCLACLAILAPNDAAVDAHLVAEAGSCADDAHTLQSLDALALAVIVQQRSVSTKATDASGATGATSRTSATFTVLTRLPDTDEEAMTARHKLLMVERVFSGSGVTAVAAGLIASLAPRVLVETLGQHTEALVDCFSITSQPMRPRSRAWMRWGEELLHACAAGWSPPDRPLSPLMDLRTPTLDAAAAVLHSMSWRPEDLLRRAPHMITTDFFAQLCQRFPGASPALCLRTAMDLVAPKLIFHADWDLRDVERAVAQLEAIADGPVANACLEPALAHVLLQHGTSPASALDGLKRLFQYLQLPLADLPRITTNCVPLTVLHLLSVTGDAQLHSWYQRQPPDHSGTSGDCAVESVSFSFLELGLRQLVTLTESASTEAEVHAALTSPVNTQVASQAMVTHSFDVLDRLMKCMGITLTQSTIESPVPQLQMSKVISAETGRRWLLALASLLRFLGPHTTLMMAKLPPILETCCTEAALVRVACAVWWEMVQQCTDEYLREHAATIVVDLVGLELYAASMDDVALAMLARATARVYTKSETAPFWQSYFKVLGGLSRLVASVRPPEGPEASAAEETPGARGHAATKGRRPPGKRGSPTKGKTSAAAETVAISQREAASSAEALASGFAYIMSSSSSKCKAIFVRALHRFLSEADPVTLHEVTGAATKHPHLIPTLLQCSRELEPADVLDALSCVGMIGAVTPQIVSLSTSAVTTATVALSSSGARSGQEAIADVPSTTPPPAQRASRLTVHTVLQWRQLAFVLLSEYCTRALANTSDPAIYDRAGYAVQELLLLFARRERTAANGPPLLKGDVLHVDELDRYSWWHELDKRSKQLLEGFTTTRYAAHRHTPSEPSYPAYHSGMPYSHWLHAFFKSLAPKCDAKFSQMMAALRNVSRRDLGLVTFLIPHMIANILENSLAGTPESASAVDIVLQEIDVLLSAAVCGSEHGQNDVLSLRSQSALETSSAAVPLSGDARATRVDEHVQFILGALEDLQQVRWSLLRIGRKLEAPPPQAEAVNEEMCLRLADRYREFFERTPASKKAVAAIDIGSNMRALRCLESQPRLQAVAVESKDVPLQRIFAALGDRDSARSIHRLMHGLPPEKAAFSYENSGEWQQAIQNCELVLQHEPHSTAHQFTALRCMRQLGQLHFMSRYAQSLLEEAKRGFAAASQAASPAATATPAGVKAVSTPRLPADSVATLQNYANEAAWRLGEWDKVQCVEALPASLASPVAQWIKLLHGKAAPESVARATHNQRRKLTPIIQRTCRENYSQCYPYVAMLHSLADLDSVSKLVQADGVWNDESQRLLIETLHARLAVTDVSLEAREPILSLHRAIFGALGLHAEVSATWLEHAQLLRDAGFPEAALIAARQSFLAAPRTQSSHYYTLAAELLYEMKAPMQAVEFVNEHVSDPQLSSTVRSDLQVLMTNWRLETGSQSKDEVIASYRAALALQETEKSHHYLALFLDKLYMVNTDNVETEMKGIRETDKVSAEACTAKVLQLIEDYAMRAVSEYARALLDGFDTVSVSLPRLLTLWLDSVVTLSEVKRTSPRSAVDADRLSKSLNRLIEVFLFDKSRCVAPHILVTALPQLLSRLCHPCPQVVTIITRAVVLLMTHFPQPCLWMVMPIAFSKQVRRMNVVKQNIIPPFVAAHASHKQVLEHVFEIFVALIELCNCAASTFANNAKLTAQPFMQKLAPMLQKANFIVPTMANLSPCITASELSEVFPSSPTFLRFADRVDVMSSLQKPKRIWVHTNEGTTVSFLCKSKDEPRKDIRMMEVASLMNTFFLKDPAARRRSFGLRRYAIAALTDDCALIEWVNHSNTLRNVVTQCYGLDGSGVRISQVKAWQAKVDNKSLTKLDMFKKHILPTAPPVLHQWFDASFATNDAWYQARNLFTQSTALWSIAGHIVGLGDRHGENLMIDMQSGEMLHVDFACLFDKGETLDVPERVRFRLTQNLVDGMGVLGTEGLFRADCEIALRCQMLNKNAVMSVVETLLHDPLVEWTQKTSRPSVNPSRLIQRVARRLDGFLDLYTVPPEKDTMALNVAGQVSKLISHSAAVENLCEMYIWWMAWV